MYDIIAQAVGIIGSIIMIISYQCKKPKNLIVMHGFGGLMFSINFLMLGAYTGALLNAINVVRSIAFAKIKSKSPIVPAVLIFAYTVATVFSFNGALSILVLLAQSLGTVLFYIGKDKPLKIGSLAFVSPAWLIHNAITKSIGGIICESFDIISLIVYMIRTRFFRKNCEK